MDICNVTNSSLPEIEDLLFCLKRLGLAALLNSGLAEIYKIMNKSKQNNYVMMQSMIFISVILAGAMMVIGNNLAVAFGLVGAVSIIRFRISVNSFLDMSFIFLSIVIGMASGLGFYFIAVIIALFEGTLMMIIHFSCFGKRYFRDLMDLEITITFERSLSEDDVPDEKSIFNIIRTTFNDDITFMGYKGGDDFIEVKFRIVWKTTKHLEDIDKFLREKFPNKKFTVKASRI